MAYLVVSYVDDLEAQDIIENPSDETLAVYKVPDEENNFCEHREGREAVKGFGTIRGAKNGWAICNKCFKAIKFWAQHPHNLIGESNDPDGKLSISYSLYPSNTWKEYVKRIRKQRLDTLSG